MTQKRLSKKKKIILYLLGLFLIVAVFSRIFIKSQIYQPSIEAQTILTADQPRETSAWLKFTGKGDEHLPNIIFYQGALVEAGAYSLWASDLAKAGYDVYLLKAPGALGILRPNLGDKVLEATPGEEFVLGGHSLGGVVASRFATKQRENKKLKGIFFLGSYPDKKGSLKESQLPVLSLTGERDGVLNQDNYQAGKNLLPLNTEYQTILGGNHAGFGSYGKQKGDNEATISSEAQQKAVAEYLNNWLGTLR